LIKLKKFIEKLESYRKKPSDDPYDNRVTHCYLKYLSEDNKNHFIEVRGWKFYSEEEYLYLAIVSWTICAGAASLEIREEDVDKFEIIKERE
jgi:hypothetical protein